MKRPPSSIAVRGSFKGRIILVFVVGFLFLISVFAVYLVNRERENLYRDSRDATTGLAQSLAVSSLPWLLANDVEGLQEALLAFHLYPGLRYAMVLAPNGRVLAHSDAVNVGQFVADQDSVALIKAPGHIQMISDNAVIVDVAVPIYSDQRQVGWARIGLGRGKIIADLRNMIQSTALFVLLSTTCSLLAAMAIANQLGRRVGLLVQMAEKVQAGNFASRAPISAGGDEITILSNNLNLMLDTLARNAAELRTFKEELEMRVAERTAQFEAANKELEAFSYSVSHDLRVPLRAIDGFSQQVLKRYEDKLDAEGKRYLNIVRDNTKKMSQLIDDILAFSRMGRLELSVSEVNIEELVRAVFEELKPTFTERGITIEIKPLPLCHGDPSMLHQVLVNLLGNAIKFTRPKPAPLVEVVGHAEGAENIYYVKDNGAGFDMQYADKLFGVFQRLHGVTEFEGTGIGLAIVKRIVTRHGGRVWAEGKVNEGATFYFTLPINGETNDSSK